MSMESGNTIRHPRRVRKKPSQGAQMLKGATAPPWQYGYPAKVPAGWSQGRFVYKVPDKGFVPFDADSFALDHEDVTKPFEAMYPNCVLVPLSKLEADERGVRNGTITSFSTAFHFLWYEGEPYDDHGDYITHQQFLEMYLLAPEASLESFEGRSVDAKVPYKRLNLNMDTAYETQTNHMVLGLTEFIGINENGKQEQTRRSFTQTTTTGIENLWWGGEDLDVTGISFMRVEMSIAKFEFTLIEEVDPVDIWSIMGAIGGVWQFVVMGFGLFFVFAEKQAPNRKLRNFRKSISKPAVFFNKRVSSPSIRASNQSAKIDALGDNLAADWIKKKRPNGSTYYLNLMTGVKQAVPPRGLTSTGANAPPPRGNLPHCESQGDRPNDGAILPSGWVGQMDGQGRHYYMNTVRKTTQWERPTQNPNCSSGGPVHHRSAVAVPTTAAGIVASPPAGDVPPPVFGSAAALPSYRTAVDLLNSSTAAGGSTTARGGPVEINAGVSLPPKWQKRVAPNNKPYFVNIATKTTQWEAPHA